jgi:hypothetical protein
VARTARTAGIDRLYHYEKFNPAHLTDVLVEQRVHCSDPANLNDPWDCRPWFDENSLDDPTTVEKFIRWIFSFTPTAPVSEQQVSATQRAILVDPDYRRQILVRFSENFQKLIPNRWRIYCLTPVPDSTLMWSHYADNHKGICLEFALDHPVLGSAQEVVYLTSYPKWAPHSFTEREARQVLLTKSDDWEYEREYRIIGLVESPARPADAHPLVVSGGFLRLPAGALRAVIAGCEADYDRISDVVGRLGLNVKIKRAIRSNTKYRLEIVE